MSLARRSLCIAIVIAWCSPRLVAQPASAPPTRVGEPPARLELTVPRRLVDESIAASEAGDYFSARAKAAEAVAGLLARPEAEQDAAWLGVLAMAGFAAKVAQDSRTARSAWQRTYEVRLATSPEDDRFLQQVRVNLAATLADLGDLSGARALEEKAIEVLSRTLPADDRELQVARMNLALTMKEQGDIEGARALLEQVLEVLSRTLPDDHADLQRARTNVASSRRALGDVAGARALQEQVLEVLTRKLSEDHPDLQRARGNLARTMKELGDTKGAKALQQQALEAFSRTLPDDHPELQLARMNLAESLLELGDHERARAIGEQVLEIRSRTLPDDHPDVQRARMLIAASLRDAGDLSGAKAMFQRIIEVRSRTLPAEHPDLLAAQGNLALTIKALGDLEGARALEEKVFEIRARTLPDDHPDLQTSRLNFGGTLFKYGDLTGARAMFEKAIEVLSRTLPDDHRELQLVRQSLASTLSEMGEFEAARVLQEKALRNIARTLPDDHPELQILRLNLALMLMGLGDLEGARAFEEKVIGIYSRTLPNDHPYLLAARANLAWTIREQGDLTSARAIQEIVLEAYSRTLDEDHPSLQLARHNLAVTLSDSGDLERAKALQEAVLEVYSRTREESHLELQMARMNLARTLRLMGDLEGARALGEKLLEVVSRTLPDDHPDLQRARQNLAWTIMMQLARSGGTAQDERRFATERSAALLASVCRAQTHAARAAIVGSPTREAEERCVRLAQTLDTPLSFCRGFGVFESTAAIVPDLAVLSETTRGAALASAALTRRAARSPRYAEGRRALRAATEELAGLAHGGTTSEEFDRARAKREAIERDLVTLAREHAGAQDAGTEFDVASFADELGEGAAAVGFRRIPNWRWEPRSEPNSTGRMSFRATATDTLFAFVVRGAKGRAAGQPPLTLVDLGPIAPIEVAARAWRESIGVGLERGASVVDSADDLTRERGDALRRLVFDPLIPALGDSKRVVVALDDVLHLVPLDALPLAPSPEGRSAAPPLVGDRWRVETRATLTELSIDAGPPSGTALVAIGGASFNVPAVPLAPAELSSIEGRVGDETLALAEESEPSMPGDPPALLRGTVWERGFSPLTHSGSEARGIGALYEEIHDGERPVLVLEKKKASRAALEALAPQARYLHVATHGWYAPESIRSWSDLEPIDQLSRLGSRPSGAERVRGMSPMLLCGLALAGANLPEDAVGRTPGLVTAEELSTLDLSNCELVVLSACDTNVGERRAGQGVASLQKALQMAGARSVITSLWKVPDEATKELMLDFYRRLWVEKKPKREALWEAKKKLREAKDERGNPLYTTRDWAAWVLTGAPD